MEMVAKTALVNGVRLRYLHREAAQGSTAPAFLMLHGLLASAETFSALAREIPPWHAIFALDLPGSAEPSSRGERDLSFHALASLVMGFANAVGLARPVLVGHSHGGALTLQIAATQPQFASAAVLLCPAHPELRRERKLVRFYLSPAGRVVAFLLPSLPRPWQAIGFRYVLGSRGRERKVPFGPYRSALRDRTLVRKAIRMIRSWERDMDALGRALSHSAPTLPVLFIWGEQDSVVPTSTAPWLQQMLPQAQSVVLRGVGHLPNDEAPEECGVLIREWMRQWMD